MLPDVSLVTVTYNAETTIADCIASILRQTGVSREIIVVDNMSRDSTCEILRGYAPDVSLLEQQENLGFGRANNLGAGRATGRYLVLLNPDARLDTPDALAKVVAWMESHPRVGLAGCRLIRPDGTEPEEPRKTYPGQRYSELDVSALPGQWAWVLGACMVVPRALFAEIGGFAPDMFLYGEDTEICLRMRQRGHEIGYIENVPITHVGGTTETTRPAVQTWTLKQQGLHQFYEKAYGREVAARVIQRELTRAQFRLWTLAFQKDNPKRAKYLAMRDVARQSLIRLKTP